MDYLLLQIDRPIPIADERVGVQVKLWDPLKTRAIPERFCGGVSLRRGAISMYAPIQFDLNERWGTISFPYR